MSRVSRASSTFLLALTVAASLAVGGCGSDEPDAAPGAKPAAPASSTAPAPSETPTAPEATPSASPTAQERHGGRHKTGTLQPHARPRRTPAVEHLLAPEDLPAVAGVWSVASADGGGADDPTVGACQKTGLVAIGALESVARTYSADGATATQVVARFGDARSAWRAHEVLEAWREDCAERVRNVSVGALDEVAVPVGTGASYRADHPRRAAGLGILRAGAYLTLVEVSAAKYPTGWEPARVAVRRVARTF